MRHIAIILAAILAAALPAQQVDEASLLPIEDAFPKQKDFKRPLYLDHHPTDPGHYYLVGQFGRIHRIPRDDNSDERELFLDWTPKTYHPDNGGHNEEGLLGFAFDPDYASNGYVYVYYSSKITRFKHESIISRLRVDHGGPARD